MNTPLPGAASVPTADDIEEKAAAAPAQPQAAQQEADEPEELWDDSDEEHEGEADERATPHDQAHAAALRLQLH